MYKIEITKIETIKVPYSTQWEQVADTGNKADNGPVYGYVAPPGETTEEVRTEVLTQTINELDLRRVILAVNRLAEK